MVLGPRCLTMSDTDCDPGGGVFCQLTGQSRSRAPNPETLSAGAGRRPARSGMRTRRQPIARLKRPAWRLLATAARGTAAKAVPSKVTPSPARKHIQPCSKRPRRGSRAMSRKQRQSRNRDRARHRLARLHAGISNIRRDASHKATTMLARTYQWIGIEDLRDYTVRR
jgi:Probable transposase